MNQRAWLLVVGLSSAACGGSGKGDGDDNGELPCEVQAVLDECVGCHVDPPRYGAPMPLLDVDDFKADGLDGSPMTELVMARVTSSTSPMPPAPSAALTDEEVAILADWIAAGTPGRTSGDSCGPDDQTEGGDHRSLRVSPTSSCRRRRPTPCPPEWRTRRSVSA